MNQTVIQTVKHKPSNPEMFYKSLQYQKIYNSVLYISLLINRYILLYTAFPGGKGGWWVRLTLPPSCAVVMKSGSLNFLEPSRPLQDLTGLL